MSKHFDVSGSSAGNNYSFVTFLANVIELLGQCERFCTVETSALLMMSRTAINGCFGRFFATRVTSNN